MNITDELRKAFVPSGGAFVASTENTKRDGSIVEDCMVIAKSKLGELCDAIDAEHQKAIRELNNLADASVLLPVDADGEIIHVGDMMERCEARGHVIALMLSEYPKKWGGGLHWGVQLEGEQAPTALDAFFRHHHAPTVDDLLFSYGQACIRASNEAETEAAKQTMLASLRHEYAAKLRMTGNGEGQ